MRMQPDGSGMNEVLDVAGGEITDLAFAPDGTLWMTTIEADGGKLCRVSNDQWGVTGEPVVTQIDGKALSCPAAVAVGADGLIIEVHNDPPHALCDGAQSLRPEQFVEVSKAVNAIRATVAGLDEQ